MADQDDDKPEVLRAAVRLGRPSRWAAFILGLAGMGAGGLAAFRAHLEAPPVAMLAVGLILALTGLAGVLPTRLKVGDNEAEFLEQRQMAVAAVLKRGVEDAPAEYRAVVQDIVDRVGEVAPDVAAPAQSASAYSADVRSMLYALAADTPGAEVREDIIWFNAAVDLPPNTDAGRSRRVLVKIKGSGNRVSIRDLDESIKAATHYAERHRGTDIVLLLVTAVASRVFHAGFASGAHGYYQATVSGPQDAPGLNSALQEALVGPPIPLTPTS